MAAKATGDLIGHKIADEITSLGKTKSKEKLDERHEIYIPLEKRQQISNDFRILSFWTYIVVKGTIIVTNPDNNVYDKKLAFKDNATIVSCISKTNNTPNENAGDLGIVMSMYSSLE